jgi:hypothetical protein
MNTSTSGTRPTTNSPRQPITGSSCHEINPASMPPAGSMVVTNALTQPRL